MHNSTMDIERMEEILKTAQDYGWKIWKMYKEIHENTTSRGETLVEDILYTAQHLLIDCLEKINLPF